MNKSTTKVLMGNAACVEAALLAGCRFFAGYPITPANEISEIMSRTMPKAGGMYLQLEDELAAINTLVGASWGGSKAMTATSGPGICLMQEGFGLATVTETPCVIIDVQRGGPGSGQSTSPAQGDVFQVRYGSNGDYGIIALAPSSAQEMFDYTLKAFNLAERFRCPVFVMSDEVVGHLREKVTIPAQADIELVCRKAPDPAQPKEQFLPFQPDADGVPPMPAFNDGYQLIVLSQVKGPTGVRATPAEAETFIRRLTSKIEDHIDEFAEVHTFMMDDADTALFAYGSVSRACRTAADMARAQGLRVGVIDLKTLWPFPEKLIRKALTGVRRVVVAEMNLGKMLLEVQRITRDRDLTVEGYTTVSGLYPTPGDILAAVTR